MKDLIAFHKAQKQTTSLHEALYTPLESGLKSVKKKKKSKFYLGKVLLVWSRRLGRRKLWGGLENRVYSFHRSLQL